MISSKNKNMGMNAFALWSLCLLYHSTFALQPPQKKTVELGQSIEGVLRFTTEIMVTIMVVSRGLPTLCFSREQILFILGCCWNGELQRVHNTETPWHTHYTLSCTEGLVVHQRKTCREFAFLEGRNHILFSEWCENLVLFEDPGNKISPKYGIVL